jgi:hypothetical protein
MSIWDRSAMWKPSILLSKLRAKLSPLKLKSAFPSIPSCSRGNDSSKLKGKILVFFNLPTPFLSYKSLLLDYKCVSWIWY